MKNGWESGKSLETRINAGFFMSHHLKINVCYPKKEGSRDKKVGKGCDITTVSTVETFREEREG